MSEEALESIKQQIAENPIILYMKGSPQAPQCGFSAQTVQCMVACGQRFAYVDILSNPEIRSTLPGYADWPTFPQLWVDGELVGGCDDLLAVVGGSRRRSPVASGRRTRGRVRVRREVRGREIRGGERAAHG